MNSIANTVGRHVLSLEGTDQSSVSLQNLPPESRPTRPTWRPCHEPLTVAKLEPFFEYTISLDNDGLGWVDLMVRPRAGMAMDSKRKDRNID